MSATADLRRVAHLSQLYDSSHARPGPPERAFDVLS